jgi:hypothetical protein
MITPTKLAGTVFGNPASDLIDEDHSKQPINP